MNYIKLQPQTIGELLLNPNYNLSNEDLLGIWYLDEDFYYPAKKCFKLHNATGSWLELPEQCFLECLKYTAQSINQ